VLTTPECCNFTKPAFIVFILSYFIQSFNF
jgi:hypothetical protein